MLLAAVLGPRKTDDELAQMRANVVKEFDIEKFSCDECGAKHTCMFTFDPYNTDGDCLAEK